METIAAVVVPAALLMVVGHRLRLRPDLELAPTLAVLAVAMGAVGGVLILALRGPLGWGFLVSAVELNLLAASVPPNLPGPGWDDDDDNDDGDDDGPTPPGPDAIDAESTLR